ncbi:50S ribosomal protein L15 [Alphaproteobacteria bacterium]|jgi:large subunit ribosomal protein L15|nr:50S ribosomal protein L15 [Alphaproteobacteria bacterium]HCL48002.1 50S ribosomal protein L15 [Rhodobiaceae bacterium]MDA8544497.1 50S ribosomal protein L15 [Alphaproteobacteria bacterium]MDA8623878.1 50S ribosomal protein L15 [Alphaproteobacteria bacterium]MDA8624944.1 50S ribosomal protein L15 [Alphaproteobacteria bacterium]
MKLNELRDNPGARKSRMRVGRGTSSGKGKTAGRGVKGQTSRSGVAIKGFEGGQMPLHMRLPKRGFNVPNPKKLNAVNLGRLQVAVEAGKLKKGATVSAASLVEAGIIRRELDGVRILAKGALTEKLDFEVAGMSKAAQDAVEKLGGKVNILVATNTDEAPKAKKATKAETAEQPTEDNASDETTDEASDETSED